MLTTTAYCWDLDIQHWGNDYYAAVAQTGALSWRSFLLGSLEAGNVTSTDKPPAAFWLMALSVRAFGMSGWSVLLPQALESVALVLLLHRTVRRLAGPLASIVAAVSLAITPVVLVLARYNHPDTLLTLCAVASAYCCTRYLQHGSARWLVLGGVAVGLAFLTKWSEALLPVPGLVAAVLLSRWHTRRRKVGLVAIMAVSGAVTALWWVALMLALPASDRPYADSSGGSVLGLILGQDGFSRLASSRLGSGAVNQVSATPGPLRLFGMPFAGQIGWLLPIALALLVLELVRTRCRPGPGYVLFGGWMVTTFVVFSLMGGAMHPYYTVLMAPAVCAVFGLGAADLVRLARSSRWTAGYAGGLGLAGVGYGIHVLVGTGTPGPGAWIAAGLAGTAVAVVFIPARWGDRSHGRVVAVALPLAAALAVGPLTFDADTLRHGVTGSNPLAGPINTSQPALYPRSLVTFLRARDSGRTWLAAVPRGTAASLLQLQSQSPVLSLGGFTGHSASPTLSQVRLWVDEDRLRYLVLTGTYTTYPDDTPPWFSGYPVARILSWARGVGCARSVPHSSYVVLDLEEGACAARIG